MIFINLENSNPSNSKIYNYLNLLNNLERPDGG